MQFQDSRREITRHCNENVRSRSRTFSSFFYRLDASGIFPQTLLRWNHTVFQVGNVSKRSTKIGIVALVLSYLVLLSSERYVYFEVIKITAYQTTSFRSPGISNFKGCFVLSFSIEFRVIALPVETLFLVSSGRGMSIFRVDCCLKEVYSWNFIFSFVWTFSIFIFNISLNLFSISA